MPNIMMDFKRSLQLLSPEEQLYEINYLISDIGKSNNESENVNKKFCILKELRTLKKKIMFNHKEYWHYEEPFHFH